MVVFITSIFTIWDGGINDVRNLAVLRLLGRHCQAFPVQ